MKQTLGAALLLLALTACSDAAVEKARDVGEGTSLSVRRSDGAVLVENNTGRPLLDVRASVETDTGASFVQVWQALDIGQTATLNFANFRSEDGTLFELSMSQPTRIKVTARDSLAGHHEATVAW
jgi:hypothetical protein